MQHKQLERRTGPARLARKNRERACDSGFWQLGILD